MRTDYNSSILPDKMKVHALHIFDRKGKTLFTKSYTTSKQQLMQDAEQLSEQRKLIFGMLFSLRELVGSLTPDGDSQGMIWCEFVHNCLYVMLCISADRLFTNLTNLLSICNTAGTIYNNQ